ncbi:YggS family pyridoxal phosphate-dependent enzyme [Desulfobotulus sp. H1]|uniref:Pyridoxal phosphate homeostasis protein n=1 Tax=Desulfobotulus pelophilus TaxID=2823377 RepID=A0ABT3N8D7_9BACT|nr:YggS family pyridoxal phosphate-dependent enzyme [Desulfobotulus pelophilus]
MNTSQRLANILQRMSDCCRRCGRESQPVSLVAVSKTKTESQIREASEAGQQVFGENYVQELVAKSENLKELALSWHFIGHLQRNKARLVVQHCELIHSIDSLRLADEINRQADRQNKVQGILLQIHMGGEETKNGILPEALPELLQKTASMPNLSVQGLMTIPPPAEHPEDNRPHFRHLRELMNACNQQAILNYPMTTLSMGMSDDFEVAIEEGATLIRIGTAVFGPRTPKT